MGNLLMAKRVIVPIPPIEKGVTQAAESLTKKIFNWIANDIAHDVHCIEDLRLELLIDGSSITSHFEIQLVEEYQLYSLDASDLDLIKHKMIMVERKLTKEFAGVSKHLYG